MSLKYEGFYIPACLITLKEEEVEEEEEEEEGVGAALHIICLLDRGSQQQGFRIRKKNLHKAPEKQLRLLTQRFVSFSHISLNDRRTNSADG